MNASLCVWMGGGGGGGVTNKNLFFQKNLSSTTKSSGFFKSLHLERCSVTILNLLLITDLWVLEFVKSDVN